MADTSGPQSVFWALFSRKGRIRRATYALGMALIFSIWWVAMSQVFAASEGSERNENWLIILGLVVIVSTYCIYALAHKRLQDIGYNGYFALLVVPLGPLLTGFLFIPLLALGLIPGQKEDNQYGPPPVR
ncbi:MAG: DUF805 domain-containing protein [Rhizobiaceae bacterium]